MKVNLIEENPTGSFFKIEPRKIPGYRFNITNNTLQYSTSNTLEQVLANFAPGYFIGRHVWMQTLIGVRGYLTDNNAKTLVIHDGLKLNQHTHYGYKT